MPADSSVTLRFFNALWRYGLPENSCLSISYRDGDSIKTGHFLDLKKAANFAVKKASKVDVWHGLAAQPLGLSESERGTQLTAVAMPGVGIDVDYDKGFGGQPRVDEFIAELPLPPSLGVLSGHGCQLYLLYRGEPLLLVSEDDRKRARWLADGWLEACRKVAKKFGATLDAVSDLARMMRPPGTRNWKDPEHTIETSLLIEQPEREYNPSDLEVFAEQMQAWETRKTMPLGGSGKRSEKQRWEFELRADAPMPIKKWIIARTNDEELQQVWDHTLSMPRDNSVSGYVSSLAIRTMWLGWTAQDIVDLGINHRRMWISEIGPDHADDPLRINDREFWEHLLDTAHAKVEARREKEREVVSSEDLEALIEEINATDKDNPVTGELRARWLHGMSMLCGLTLESVRTQDRHDARWEVTYTGPDGRRVVAASAAEITEGKFWRVLMLSGGSKVPPPPGRSFSQTMLGRLALKVGIMVEVYDDAGSKSDEFWKFLIEVAQNANEFDPARIVKHKIPFRKIDAGPKGLAQWGGAIECFYISVQFVAREIARQNAPELPQSPSGMLKSLGFRSRSIRVEREGGHSAYDYYAIPLSRMAGESERLGIDSEWTLLPANQRSAAPPKKSGDDDDDRPSN